MVWIPGGTFTMGSDHHYPEEAPAHRAQVDGFWMERTPVTNAQFRRFVKATGYITLAERPADPAQYPDALPELLEPSSAVFRPPAAQAGLQDAYQWWRYVAGANWRHPEGPSSSIKHLDHHPVVHIAYDDAFAYASWAGKALPTEAEWECAAWGGVEGKAYAWGDALTPGGRTMANIWYGAFPHHNSRLDGWERTSPVGSFPANGYGLLDMIGNVWEWTTDYFALHNAPTTEGCCTGSPMEKQKEKEKDIPRRVAKGGSHLCAENYCQRYRPAARLAQPVDTSTSHLGFRCIVRGASAPAI